MASQTYDRVDESTKREIICRSEFQVYKRMRFQYLRVIQNERYQVFRVTLDTVYEAFDDSRDAVRQECVVTQKENGDFSCDEWIKLGDVRHNEARLETILIGGEQWNSMDDFLSKIYEFESMDVHEQLGCMSKEAFQIVPMLRLMTHVPFLPRAFVFRILQFFSVRIRSRNMVKLDIRFGIPEGLVFSAVVQQRHYYCPRRDKQMSWAYSVDPTRSTLFIPSIRLAPFPEMKEFLRHCVSPSLPSVVSRMSSVGTLETILEEEEE